MTDSDRTPESEPSAEEAQTETEIRAALRTSGEVLPAPLQAAVFGDSNNVPEFVVESAEGVVTFRGFDGENPRPLAERWLKERFEHIANTYPADAEPAPTEQKADKPAKGTLGWLPWSGPKP